MPWTKEQREIIIKENIESLGFTTEYKDWVLGKDTFTSPGFLELAKYHNFEDIWVGGGPYEYGFFVGYWCGKDNDLICVLPLKYKETEELNPYLSPEGKTPQEGLNLDIKKRRKLLKFTPREDLNQRYRLKY